MTQFLKRVNRMIMSGAAIVLLSACDGILADIYDEADDTAVSEYGFVKICTASEPGTIYVDASSYTRWVYIDFAGQRIDTLEVSESAPEHWDIAVHRYDAKTNGGSVLETGATGFSALQSIVGVNGNYVADEWTTETIVTDMSTMMDGYLGYVASYYNGELSKWLDVDTTNMPPTYTMSNKVYLVRLSDGTQAAVKLSNYMNGSGVKGYMTIQYIYPFE